MRTYKSENKTREDVLHVKHNRKKCKKLKTVYMYMYMKRKYKCVYMKGNAIN